MRTIAVVFLSLFQLSIAIAEAANSTKDKSPEIYFDRATTEIFPEIWLTERINARAELLSDGEKQRCEMIVAAALAKYPEKLLSANLKKLYLLGGLEYSGVRAGGTNSRTAVYVVCKPTFKTSDVEKILHAEFSSILFRNFANDFDAKAWNELNPKDFQYRSGGVQAIKDKKTSWLLVDPVLEQHFLGQYALSSIQEDFNTFVGLLFMGDARLWNAVDKYPKVKRKAELVIKFYSKLDTSFTPEFFQSLRKSEKK